MQPVEIRTCTMKISHPNSVVDKERPEKWHAFVPESLSFSGLSKVKAPLLELDRAPEGESARHSMMSIRYVPGILMGNPQMTLSSSSRYQRTGAASLPIGPSTSFRLCPPPLSFKLLSVRRHDEIVLESEV